MCAPSRRLPSRRYFQLGHHETMVGRGRLLTQLENRPSTRSVRSPLTSASKYENRKRERERKPKRVVVLVLGCGAAPQNRSSAGSVHRVDLQHGFAGANPAPVRSKLASRAVPIRCDVTVSKAATWVTGPLDSLLARDLDARMKFPWALVG